MATPCICPFIAVRRLTLRGLRVQAFNNVGDSVKSALYCHSTLSRQLESSTFDRVEWALNSATLSQFYLPKQMFR